MKLSARKDIKSKSEQFLADRKNANIIVELNGLLEDDNHVTLLSAIKALHAVYTTLLKEDEMYLDDSTLNSERPDVTAEEKYKLWLRDRYNDCKHRLIDCVNHEEKIVQEMSLCSLMKFIELEGRHPLTKLVKNYQNFPMKFYFQLIDNLLHDRSDKAELIIRFEEYLHYDDVRFLGMKHVLTILKNTEVEKNDLMMNNIFSFLSHLNMPKIIEDKLSNYLVEAVNTDVKIKMRSYSEHCKLFSTLWLEFLRQKISTKLYKQVLMLLHDNVMPHMTSPIMLADFLTQSYNIGGVVSLLALNGLFILVNNYNFEYPNFYEKLYTLLDPSLFHVKYKARFFFLADLFLTSSHVPAYLIAAFIKKLSRLALTAPPNGLLLIIPLIYNLINRHPSCQCLIQQTESCDMTNDPFDSNEMDPLKCNALKSSLWELKSLQNHYNHLVSNEAKKINHVLQTKEIDLTDLLELNVDSLINKDSRKKLKSVPLTFKSPDGLRESDSFAEIWALN